MTSSVVLSEPSTHAELSDGRRDTTGDWFCVRVRETRFPCGHVIEFASEAEHPHRVVVWPSDNDPNLAKFVEYVRGRGGIAEPCAYEQSFGDCVSFYARTPS